MKKPDLSYAALLDKANVIEGHHLWFFDENWQTPYQPSVEHSYIITNRFDVYKTLQQKNHKITFNLTR